MGRAQQLLSGKGEDREGSILFCHQLIHQLINQPLVGSCHWPEDCQWSQSSVKLCETACTYVIIS